MINNIWVWNIVFITLVISAFVLGSMFPTDNLPIIGQIDTQAITITGIVALALLFINVLMSRLDTFSAIILYSLIALASVMLGALITGGTAYYEDVFKGIGAL